jgi:hypothetical protein
VHWFPLIGWQQVDVDEGCLVPVLFCTGQMFFIGGVKILNARTKISIHMNHTHLVLHVFLGLHAEKRATINDVLQYL